MKWFIVCLIALILCSCDGSSDDVEDTCLIYDPNQSSYLNICVDD